MSFTYSHLLLFVLLHSIIACVVCVSIRRCNNWIMILPIIKQYKWISGSAVLPQYFYKSVVFFNNFNLKHIFKIYVSVHSTHRLIVRLANLPFTFPLIRALDFYHFWRAPVGGRARVWNNCRWGMCTVFGGVTAKPIYSWTTFQRWIIIWCQIQAQGNVGRRSCSFDGCNSDKSLI